MRVSLPLRHQHLPQRPLRLDRWVSVMGERHARAPAGGLRPCREEPAGCSGGSERSRCGCGMAMGPVTLGAAAPTPPPAPGSADAARCWAAASGRPAAAGHACARKGFAIATGAPNSSPVTQGHSWLISFPAACLQCCCRHLWTPMHSLQARRVCACLPGPRAGGEAAKAGCGEACVSGLPPLYSLWSLCRAGDAAVGCLCSSRPLSSSSVMVWCPCREGPRSLACSMDAQYLCTWHKNIGSFGGALNTPWCTSSGKGSGKACALTV